MGFAGTPAFARCVLDALHRAGYTIPVVLTRPDRPSGRGLKQTASPVAILAERLGLRVEKPASLRDRATIAALTAIGLDVLVVAAYGMILPPDVLGWPAHGCLNVHASLLPRWRGAAPIVRAIEAGDRESGITIMQMDAGLDTGAIVGRCAITIDPRETAAGLHDRLAALGSGLVVEAVAALARDGRLESTPQPSAGVTWAAKVGPGDAPIDWTQPAAVLDRRIRALSPAPGAVMRWDDRPVKVLEALPVARSARGEPLQGSSDDHERAGPSRVAGSVLDVAAGGIEVACGETGGDVLMLTRVQPAGGRAMTAAAFAAGHRIVRGSRFR